MFGKSCTTQLLDVYHNVGRVLDSGGQTDVLNLDFSKAFDSVSHRLLLHKLRSFGVNGSLLKWLTSYLSNRKQRVVMEGEASAWLPVLSGVPQGSILGPLLFVLYINDLPNCVTSSEVALFADDAKCFREIRSASDCHLLQHDLNKIHEWSRIWKLNFNVSKCKLLTIARALKFQHPYSLDGVVLERVDSIQDLGITVSSDLSWHKHIDQVVSKCNRVNGMIKRAIGRKAPADVTMRLFNTLSRSIAEYSSPVWSPHTVCDITRVERIQRNITRHALHYPDGVDYGQRCRELGVLPLSYRREIQDLCLFFKCTQGLTAVNSDLFPDFYCRNNGRRTGDSGPLLRKPLTRTELFMNSYFNRINRSWNSLPVLIRSSSGLDEFRDQLVDYYTTRMTTFFQSNNVCTWRSTCRCANCLCLSAQTQFY